MTASIHLDPAAPLLSVVIATRNRVIYCQSAIESILAIPDTRLELVIQDNSDTRELADWVACRASDARLRYRYTPPPLSSIGNFNAALELASGEYVCLIGDDDGINPEILDAAAWAQAHHIDSIGGRCRVNYLWGGSGAPSTLFTRVGGAEMAIEPFVDTISLVDVPQQMAALMDNGGVYYLDFQLPKMYHGLVRRACLEQIRSRTGHYVGGLSPDIYSSLAVACVAQRVAVTDYPLTIPGACGASTSVVEGSIKRHSKRIEDAPHWRAREDYQWSPMVPRLYSVETIWSESALVALAEMGRDDLVARFNLPRMAAFCFANNRAVADILRRELPAALRARGENLAWGALRFGAGLASGPGPAFVRRVWNRVLLSAGVRTRLKLHDLPDMQAASAALGAYLRAHNHSFQHCMRHFGASDAARSVPASHLAGGHAPR
ncbi:glycosyltransferase [Massilia sp. PAMC28688]|uniref:glycosyltransferase family 2 protein n=1 Tax=Massilia sp. PAMC28688 TaxID=2861283 RepID=UPI001C6385AD|nr:glycosyltransferase family A protein [Massilia sp. PAMC28688]QYF91981.1 glycosyltransferase [Massilia sp. PAMC28688]